MIKAREIIFILAIGILLLLVFLPGDNVEAPSNDLPTGEENESEIVSYFRNEIEKRVVKNIGQPIEGFEPSMFLETFPGLEASDFHGVDALLGIYWSREGKILFEQDKVKEIHSAARAISDEGYDRLLRNILVRVEFSVKDRNGIDILISEFLLKGDTPEKEND